jgi:hypothetical protein
MARQDNGRDESADGGRTAGGLQQTVTDSLEADARLLADRYELPSEAVLGILARIRRALTDVRGGNPAWAKETFLEAVETLGAEQALDLFEREDLEALLGRVSAMVRLSLNLLSPLGMLICSREALIIRTETAISDLESNRGRLVEEGLGWNCARPDFHDRLLMHLYPIRPYWLATYPTEDLRRLTADQVHRTRGAPPSFGDPSISEHEMAMPGSLVSESDDLAGTVVSVGGVAFAWLSRRDAAQVEAARAKLLDLKIDVLRHLVRALRQGDASGLWPGCLKLLTEALTASEVQFLLRMDVRLTKVGVLADEQSNASNLPGGGDGGCRSVASSTCFSLLAIVRKNSRSASWTR